MRPLTRIVCTNVQVVSRLRLWPGYFITSIWFNISYLHTIQIGGQPTKNKFYTPSANGCGSLGLGIPTEYLPISEMSNCCDEHDICYDTCNSDKELCDLDFKRCLYKYCDTYEKSAVGGDMMVKGKFRCTNDILAMPICKNLNSCRL